MNPIRVAVIGAGYLGRFHAEKYLAAAGCRLVAVVDPDLGRAAAAADAGARACSDHHAILDAVDAVSVVVPTAHHFAVARDCLERGIHVLLEKPMTNTLAEADALIALAQSRGAVLQVGHLERFNPVSVRLLELAQRPRFIECHRLAPFTGRSTDVNVVLDLMIHDIDLILSIVPSAPVRIEASGAPVLSDSIDIANARLTFGDGCVANVTASRISRKTERKMRIFQPDMYLSADFHARTVTTCRRVAGAGDDAPQIDYREAAHEGDALALEIAAFLEAVRTGKPKVPGEEGRRALAAALEITRCLTPA